MREQTAIEAVSEHFSVDDGRIALEVAAVKQLDSGWAGRAKPRLRFDKVALRLIEHVRDSLQNAVPDGETLVVTVTAPIRMWSKTAGVLEDAIRSGLARGSPLANTKHVIHDNRIEVRRVKHGLRRASKVVGFVHNPESDPGVLFDLTRSLIECIGAAADVRPPATDVRDRWLVLANQDGPTHVEAFRATYPQLLIPTEFKRIFMIFAGDRIEELTG